ncbi:ABC transporter substrate-binding protein [Streptacidiphilus jiangxiensis]|uniref:ABC-type nitrate/sulfonate/bicarbonate transport system, substrate-binding protein n=1 Tax=Streptacidiphilus jiangxiensis TaxID=235985 RepID=A0A1H7PQK6_STRJI|nr:ABC transporter substrate-binding protein [Streptacidiphilus jiangxiensis]SEL37327.1 ABC-type nitrate/sulfonate/bicarbonate transport system, substrate-binding protein [Streptacidiphilus jiangxiensis]
MHAFPSRRRFLALLGSSAAAVTLAGCGGAAAASGTGGQARTLRYQGWAGQVLLPELAEDLGYFGDVKLDWVGDTISGPQDIQSAATGQVDFGGAFNGAVVKLAANHAPVQAVISYYGVDRYSYNGFYVLAGSSIRTGRDLIGAKVGVNTLGAHDEAMLDIYLKRQGLTPDEIAQVQPVVLPPVSTEQALREKQIEVAVLGGVLRDKALAEGGIRPLFTDYQLLGSFSAGTYVMTERFLRQNPDTARTFVTGTAKAIEWARRTPREQVVARMTDIVHKRGRNEDPAPLKYFQSFGVAETGGRITDAEFQLWLDWLADRGTVPKGSVTAGRLYTNQYNAYRAGS